MRHLRAQLRYLLPQPPEAVHNYGMAKRDMSVSKAENIRRKLADLIDRCEIYPRQNSYEDSVGLGLFSRMLRVHESVCLLVRGGHRRDAVILARTLCEASLLHYWLTNRDTVDRHDRYVKFWAQVKALNLIRIQKHFSYTYAPGNEYERKLINEAKTLFKNGTRWNSASIEQMAGESDEFNKGVGGNAPNLSAQYELFYFWCSLVSHATIVAIENFYPIPGRPFSTREKPDRSPILPETFAVFLATSWLFSIALRLNQSLGLRRDVQLDKIFQSIKRL